MLTILTSFLLGSKFQIGTHCSSYNVLRSKYKFLRYPLPPLGTLRVAVSSNQVERYRENIRTDADRRTGRLLGIKVYLEFFRRYVLGQPEVPGGTSFLREGFLFRLSRRNRLAECGAPSGLLLLPSYYVATLWWSLGTLCVAVSFW